MLVRPFREIRTRSRGEDDRLSVAEHALPKVVHRKVRVGRRIVRFGCPGFAARRMRERFAWPNLAREVERAYQ